MKKSLLKMMTALLCCAVVLSSCGKEALDSLDDATFGALQRAVQEMAAKEQARRLEELQKWEPGCVTDLATIALFGYENCFKVVTLTQEEWNNRVGGSYFTNPAINISEMREVRTLTYYEEYDTTTGQMVSSIRTGMLICNFEIANLLLNIFRQLYENKYPIQNLVPSDIRSEEEVMLGNFSFCYNYNSGHPDAVSEWNHLGLAVCLNPANPPKSGDLAVRLFEQSGFPWGGNEEGGKSYLFGPRRMVMY